jgi:1-acyl-sn-glycerol-3-phosphate acyltransferase
MKRNSIVYFFARWVAQRVLSIFYRIEIRCGNALPMDGPAVILPKHQFWTDIPLVSLCFPFPLLFVAKRELFRYPGIRTCLSLLGGIPLDRERSVRTLKSFRYLLSRLEGEERIVIFPEGTYFRGAVGPGKHRLLGMILKFQSESEQPIPFVPVGIRYGERSGWRRRVEICIGSPLFAEGESDAPDLTCRVMKEIGQLCRLPQESRRLSTVEHRQDL